MEVKVVRAGMLTTVQDLGRRGLRSAGVPLGGAMDAFALRLANLLVGNAEGAPALEMTLVGAELEFSSAACVAVTGGDLGGPERWRPQVVPAGGRLKFGAAKSGCRAYVAVAGGWQVPHVLGGCGTYLRAGLGGHEGRALRDGDVLRVADGARTAVAEHWRINERLLPAYAARPVVRAVRGAQAEEFGEAWWRSEFKVSARSDRMGLRLEGPRLERTATRELLSTAVAPGTVQVPPEGSPIVLMADAQTIGGYPQLAHVISTDLPLLAQLRPGDAVSFRRVALGEAHQLLLAREHALALLREGLAQKFR